MMKDCLKTTICFIDTESIRKSLVMLSSSPQTKAQTYKDIGH